jgi:hypothetical protein
MALASAPMFVATLLTGAMSGVLLDQFCPEKGPRHSETMWLVIGSISFTSPLLLFLLKDHIAEPSLAKSTMVSPRTLGTDYGSAEINY